MALYLFIAGSYAVTSRLLSLQVHHLAVVAGAPACCEARVVPARGLPCGRQGELL